MLISEDYREQNRKLHLSNPSYGISGSRYAELVKSVCKLFDSTDILDYGCGKQKLKEALPEYGVTGYDPCIAGMDAAPEPHDIVYCGDVLEHIEPDCIDAVLSDIKRVTKKAALLVTNSEPALKRLPDGRNAHLIQRPMWWWAEKIGEKFYITTYENRRGDHLFLAQNPLSLTRRWDWVAALAKEHGWRRGAEIGVKEGRFSVHLAHQNIEMTAVDLWAARPEMKDVIGGETYEDWDQEAIYKKFTVRAQGLPISIIHQDSREAHSAVPNAWLDFVFIDGDHSFEGVKADIKNWLPKVRPGGMLCGHDYDMPTVAQAVTSFFSKENIIEGPDSCWAVWC